MLKRIIHGIDALADSPLSKLQCVSTPFRYQKCQQKRGRRAAMRDLLFIMEPRSSESVWPIWGMV